MKVAVIGAGKVGSAVVGKLMNLGGISQIVLVDVDMNKVEGEILDYEHTTSYDHHSGVNLLAGTYADCQDAGIIIITAGPSIKPGQTRIELAEGNTEILRGILAEIDRYNQEALIIMVSNPVDVLTYGAYRLSSRPKQKIIGTGTLVDSARLMKILGKIYKIDSKKIFSFMLGEHGQTSFPAWSIANICGLSFEEFGKMEQMEIALDKVKVEEEAKNIGIEIFHKKGYTNHGIAAGVLRLVIAIMSDEKTILPVSVVLEGEYGISDIALSVPSIVGKNGIEKVLEFPLSDEELRKLRYSADFLKESIKKISY